jgi:biotin transport system substrate-specific component
MKTANVTLANRLWPRATRNWALEAVLAVCGSLLVAGAAQVSVPMFPVPMTLQTLAVLGIGAAYGSRLGAITLVLYALEGLMGLPFFADGQAGFFKDGMLISSGGYIIGFIMAAALVGWLAEKGWSQNPMKMALATLMGGVLLYVPGLIWLAIWAAKVKGLDISDAIQAAIAWGFVPFVLGDIIKAAIAGLGIGSALRANPNNWSE